MLEARFRQRSRRGFKRDGVRVFFDFCSKIPGFQNMCVFICLAESDIWDWTVIGEKMNGIRCLFTDNMF